MQSCRAMHQIPSMHNKVVDKKKGLLEQSSTGQVGIYTHHNLTAKASVIKDLGNIVMAKGNFLPPLPQVLHTQSISPGFTR